MKTKLCSSILVLCVDCRLLPWLSYVGAEDYTLLGILFNLPG